MNPLNDLFNSGGQFQWPAQNTFDQRTQHPNSGIGAPESDLQAAASSLGAPTHGSNGAPTAGPSRANEFRTPQTRHRETRWESHQTELKELYLVQKKTLEEIRNFMGRERSFSATIGFGVWGWSKNLPVETAQFMVLKANERKRAPLYKDTTFEFGGLNWTKERAEATIKRSKKQAPEIIDMSTPSGVDYRTPGNADVTSPETALTPYGDSANVEKAMTISSGSSSDEWEPESDDDPEPLPLVWNGHTRSDVRTLFHNAQTLARTGDAVAAENMLKTSITAYKYLLGPTHEETNKVIFTVATFYFERDRVQDAYHLIEESCRVHVQTAGVHDHRTQNHVQNVAELLNGWNKADDALAFLARATELAEKRRTPARYHRRKRPSAPTRRLDNTQHSLLLEAARSITDDPQDPTQLDYGLSIARTNGSNDKEAVEQLLLATIKQCGQDTERLAVQRLKAWGELLRLYQKTDDAIVSIATFENAHAAFMQVLRMYPWDVPTRRKFESFKVVEAALELVAPFVKANYLEDAKRMFQLCEEKAISKFGDEDERTIWMFISIGLVYQRYRGWNDAKPWFERALAVAMEKYDENDGIRIALEEAMEVRHFSYINDEGRPFKTIFGVNGLRIIPNRLHMD